MPERETDRIRWGLIAVVVAVAGIATFVTGFTVGGSAESILNTLARAQAAVFAIVFSVLILGIRLSASRYSPRLVSTFSSDSNYIQTVGIFGFSIGFDVLLLFIIDVVSALLLTVLLMTSVGLAAGAFWTMWGFVNETLESTTPEGIIERLDMVMSTNSIIEEAQDADGEPTNPDPFLKLLSVISSFIEDGDMPSASAGLKVLGNKISTLLEEAAPVELDEDSPVEKSLKKVCVNRIPGLAEEAVNHELAQTAREAIDASKTIGVASIEEGVDQILAHVVRGLSRLSILLGYSNMAESVRYDAIDTGKDLLRQAVGEERWDGAARGTRLLGSFAASSVSNRTEAGYNRGYTTLLILGFPKILLAALNEDGEYTNYPPSRWVQAFLLDEIEGRELLLASCYSSMTELTAAAVRYKKRLDEDIVRWEQVVHGWSEGLERLDDSGPEGLTELWLATVFYFEYVFEELKEFDRNDFRVSAVREVDPEFAMEVVDSIQEGDIEPRKLADLDLGHIDPVEMPLTGGRDLLVTDPSQSFNEWLQIRRQTLQIGRRSGSESLGHGDDDGEE